MDPVSNFMRRDPIPSGIACVFGHFHPTKHQHHHANRFTALRNPIEKIISIYAYFKATPPMPAGPLHQYMLHENLDVMGLARPPLLRRLMSETCFGNVNTKSFEVIGRNEEREQTNAALCALLGFEPFDNVRANVTPPSVEREHISADPRILRQLASILRDDVPFYARWAKP